MFSTRIRKVIAVFLLVNFISSVVIPPLSYALTAGPTAPEATSFEPVDTTNLVDLKTGDFNYTIPLLEVPGPGGGYPLALSYHAGILPGQEASWTGLGFNVSPGAITRLVNGYPDDHFGIKNVDRVFWEGGKASSGTIGISFGIANCASVSADLVFANDTYKGSGVGISIGASYGFTQQINSGMGGSMGIGVSVGVTPYGDPYFGAGVSGSVGIGRAGQAFMGGGMGGSMSVGYNSLGGIESNAQVSLSTGLLGISLSTQASKPQLSVGGATAGVYNSKRNNVSVNSDNFAIDIPIYAFVSIRLGRSYQRYWIDETANVSTFGSLYSSNVGLSSTVAYDNHDLLDIDLDLAEFPNPEKVMGGSFPEYDLYTVTGQGIGGNIRPYHFTQDLYRQHQTRAYSLSLSQNSTAKPQFRFVNDFSNRMEYDPAPVKLEDGVLKHEFSGSRTTGPNGDDGFANNQLAGSKHIQWFTNHEIVQRASGNDPYVQGLINTTLVDRRNDRQVGAFVITKSDGITYHYALPVYSYDEFSKSVNKEQEGRNFNTLSKPEPYAYEWLLTAVTGPDFVDRNNNGLADFGDWGYWVNFEYEKWLDDYKWRNPGEGLNEDVDGQFEFYSFGKKQVYYLSKITTQTHVAVFNKSPRHDGREVMDLHAGGFDAIPTTEFDNQCFEECRPSCSDRTCLEDCQKNCEKITGWTYARPLLKLDNISLFRYSDHASGKNSPQHALRVIEFGYDYALAGKTPNSYDTETPTFKQGKLTLKSLSFNGKKGVSLTPPMVFNYGENPNYRKDATDMWGFYKSDYKKSEALNLDHLTTASSAEHTDAWSLTEVTTSLGASLKIKYESDYYKRPVLYNSMLSPVKSFELNKDDRTVKLNFADDVNLTPLAEMLSGSTVHLLVNQKFCDSINTNDCRNLFKQVVKELSSDLIEISANSFTVKNLYDQIASAPHKGRIFKSASLAAGHLLLAGNIELPGGGLRVTELEHLNGHTNSGSATLFEYEEGTTAYEPIKLDKVTFDFGGVNLDAGEIRNLRKAYLKGIHKGFSNLFFLSRFLPPPGILYKHVTVRERVKQNGVDTMLPNYSRYQFEVFDANMIDYNPGPVEDEGTVRVYDLRTLFSGVFDWDIIEKLLDIDDLDYRSRVLTRRIDFKDKTARTGNLKSVTLFDEEGKPVVETVNHYLDDEVDYTQRLSANFKNQGVIEESFSRAKRILYHKEKTPYGYTSGNHFSFPFSIIDDYDYQQLGLISKRITYPSIQTGVTTKNYKTGIVTTKETIAFDYYSGEPLKVVTVDSYGNRYLSEAVPAYSLVDGNTKSPVYPAMGLKIYDVHNKNMLSQTAATATYKVDEHNTPEGLISASVQTWSDKIKVLGLEGAQNNIYRKHAVYQWNGSKELNADGTYDVADFNAHPFNWLNLAENPSWERTGELTLYDVYTHALEAMDINGNFAATRMSNDHEKVLASAANASYHEIASTGSEYYAGNSDDDGGVNRGEGNPSSARAHTGRYSLLVGYNSKGFNATLPGDKADLRKRYRASVWVYVPGEGETQAELDKVQLYYVVNGVEKEVHPTLQKNKSKSWYLLNIDIAPSNGHDIYVGVRNNASRGAYFDDFRVHPLDAGMVSYVYDPSTGELNYMLDNNNFYTRYEYDAVGRLIRSSRETLNFDFGDGKESFKADHILQEVNYNYGKN